MVAEPKVSTCTQPLEVGDAECRDFWNDISPLLSSVERGGTAQRDAIVSIIATSHRRPANESGIQLQMIIKISIFLPRSTEGSPA